MPDTFTFCPTFASQEKVENRIRTAPFGDGYVHRVLDGINVEEAGWQLQFRGVGQDQVEEMRDFIRDNAATWFNWTPPGWTDEIQVYCDGWEVSWDDKNATLGLIASVTIGFKRAYVNT